MTKSYVVISDTQMGYNPDSKMYYEDRKAVAAVIRFIKEYQPDEVIHIGDVVDYPTPSRWNKGTASEFSDAVQRDSEHTVKNLIAPLREAYDGPIGMLEGNHDLRPREYLTQYAPALGWASSQFSFENLLQFEEYEIRKLPEFYDFAPGWVATHGHRGGIRINSTGAGGATALAGAKKMGKSVVMGHTHRLGVGSFSMGYNNQTTQLLTGFEVGNLMNMKAAGYLKGGAGNWLQGFGLLHVNGKHVQATPVPITGKKFIVEGQTFSV